MRGVKRIHIVYDVNAPGVMYMAMPETPKEYAQMGKRILKAEMQRRGVSYKELALALQARGHGTSANEANIRNQINRGGFSAAFFIECCLAMGSYVVRLGEPNEP